MFPSFCCCDAADVIMSLLLEMGVEGGGGGGSCSFENAMCVCVRVSICACVMDG